MPPMQAYLLSRRRLLGHSAEAPVANVADNQPRYGGRLRLGILDGNWLSFDMNLEKPPFNDPRVREVLRLLAASNGCGSRTRPEP